jgi:deferrochelatase/peroxidase EfeB
MRRPAQGVKKKTLAGKAKKPARSSSLDLPDIQGLLLRGYKHFDFIRHLIFKIEDVGGAQALCKALSPPPLGAGPLTITDSAMWPPTGAKPAYRLNIAFTCTGLQKIIGAANYSAVQGNSTAYFTYFDPGAAADAAAVGDVGSNAPWDGANAAQWWPRPGWQLPTPPDLNCDFDVILSLFARTPAGRDSYCQTLLAMIPAGAMELTFQQDSDPLPEGADFIHFGFRDGISQPRIEGAPGPTAESAGAGMPPGALFSLATATAGDDPDDRPIVPSWNFIIAVPNGGGYLADPFLFNGSFGAFRLLYQDVEAFENFIATDPNPERLAAKMCGRWRDGTPLEVSPDKPDPSLKGFELSNFQYLTASAHQRGPKQEPDFGQICPYAAHTRRTNPRDDTNVFFNDGTDQNNRILRRARPYGPAYTPAEKNKVDRGLVGYFIGANLGTQFRFVMQNWLTASGFSGMDYSPDQSGYDPLFGASPPSGYFAYCTDSENPAGNYATVPSQPQTPPPPPPPVIPQFIVTKGGLYVFFPSITALGLIAEGKIAS